jgi:predicted nucleotidyltransferase
MKFLHPSFVKILHALLNCEVEFLMIGGYAVNYYGYGRPTGDMDLWLRPDNSNKEKCLEAFKVLDYPEKSIENLKPINFEEAQVFFIGKAPLRIDFLTSVNIVDFEEAWKKRKILQYEDLELPVIDFDHLILTKMTTGRSQDKIDLEELQKIHRQENRE